MPYTNLPDIITIELKREDMGENYVFVFFDNQHGWAIGALFISDFFCSKLGYPKEKADEAAREICFARFSIT